MRFVLVPFGYLLRDFTFVVGTNGYRWAKNVKRLLQVTYIKVSNHPEKTLGDADCPTCKNVIGPS